MPAEKEAMPEHVEDGRCRHCGGEVDEMGYAASLAEEEGDDEGPREATEAARDAAFSDALERSRE